MTILLFSIIDVIYLGLFFYFFKQSRVQLINLLIVGVLGYFFVNINICRREMSDFLHPHRMNTFLALLALMPCVLLLCMHQTLSFLDSFKKLFSIQNVSYLFCVFIGLCFGFLRRIELIDFSLTASDLKRASVFFIALMCATVLFLTWMLFLHVKWAYNNRQCYSYLGINLVVLILFAGVFFYFYDTHYFHLHHYALFLILVFLFRLKPFWSTYLQALFLGGYIEGVSSWNYAPVFMSI